MPDARHPTIRWRSSTRANTSNWSILSYQHAGGQTSLQLTFDRATREVSSGSIIALQLHWLLPRVACTFALETVPAPEGAAAGRHVLGSCAGSALYFKTHARRYPLMVSFAGPGGAQVSSASSPFDPNCSPSSCATRVADWAVDATLGLSAPATRLEARVHIPSGPFVADDAREIRVPLG